MKGKREVLWWVVIALTTLLIWGQSLFGQDLSRLQSETVQGFLGSVFGEWIYGTFFYQNIRKVAHFVEFCILGLEWVGYRRAMRGARHVPWWVIAVAGPLTAICDELLQFISARGPMVSDVLLDCAGYFCGVSVLIFCRKKYSCAK